MMLTKRFITPNGTSAVKYFTSTKATRSIIFVGGIGSGARAWDEVIEKILDELPDSVCVSYDLRCHGTSTCSFPRNGESLIKALAQDLEKVVSSLNPTLPFTLVGHSLGGAVVQEAVSLCPTLRNTKKILICSSIKTQLSFIAKPSKLYGLVKWLTKNKKAGKEVSSDSFLRFKNTGDFHLPRILTEIFRLTPSVFLAFWLGCFSYRNTKLELINNEKTLVLYGKDDHIFPKKYQENTYQQLSKAKMKLINSNHVASLNAPKEISDQIINFLKIS